MYPIETKKIYCKVDITYKITKLKLKTVKKFLRMVFGPVNDGDGWRIITNSTYLP